MIADVIHDTLRQIDDYRIDMPTIYAGHACELDALTALMRAALRLLDATPGPVPADIKARRAEIRRLLVSLPVDELENAVLTLDRDAARHRSGGAR